MQQEIEISISEEEIMSIEDSEEGEDGSDGFSDRSSSEGESVKSLGSRKRRADESPKREETESGRRGFPGVVLRSEAGCRIHLPSTTVDANAAPNAAPDIPTMPTTEGTTVAPDISTTHTTREMTVAPNIPTPPTIVEVLAEANVCLTGTMGEIAGTTGVPTGTTIARETLSLRIGSTVPVNVALPNVMARPLTVEGWGRDALMVEGIFCIIEGMEPPWITLNVLDAAALQFPIVDREILRHTIMTILMSQRRCVVRQTRAGLRLGPRTDREGNAFVELDLDYADRYSNFH